MFEYFKGIFADKQPEKSYNLFDVVGSSGTEIFSGLISQEYLADLEGQKGITVWNKMRCSDTMVQSCIQAFKLPLLSANYFIEGENEEYKEFIENALFKNKNQSWNQFIEEAYNFPVFGYYYFEKIFGMSDDGKIVWKKFAPRIPSAHCRWPTKEFWGIEQSLSGTESVKDDKVEEIKDTTTKIPFDKLLYFVYQKEGDNWEGRSILRSLRQAWLYKQKMLKMMAVYYERYGVGIPVIKMANPNKKDIALYKDMFRNLRSNQQSYIILVNPDDELTMFGADKSKDLSTGMESYINYLDRQIAKAFLSMFLTTGDTGVGSNAKQGIDVEFFMLTIKSIAKNFAGVMNGAISELIMLNYPTAKEEDMPTLQITEIEKIDQEKFSNMIEKLTNTGYLSTDNKTTQDYVRESLDLPEISDEEFKEEQEKKKEEQAKIDEQMQKEEKEVKEEKVVEEKIVKKEVAKEKDKMSDKDDKSFFLSATAEKEKLYQQAINEEEKYLQDTYKNKFLPALEATEDSIKSFLLKKYDSLKTETIIGVKKIKRSGNQGIKAEMIKGVNAIMSSFDKRLKNPMFMDSIHKKSMARATKLLKDVDKKVEFFDIEVNKGDFNSFISGYKSNMSGVVFNEGRRIKEKIVDNLTQGVSFSLARKQIEDIYFNRNIYKLSAITHPRALFRRTIQTQATSEGVTHYKALVPSFVLLSLIGISASVLYAIKTQQDWDKLNGEKDNINVVGGMGIHHNSQIYFMPITMDEYEEQELLSRIQRAEFEELNQIDESN